MSSRRTLLQSLRRQSGFTLLELMIAMGIGLFLLAGIVVVMGLTRQNFNAQAGMGQLQDDQRMAVNMLVMVVEHAGFYNTPQNDMQADKFPAVTPFAAGQSVSGTSGTGTNPDSLSVRYRQSPAGSADSDFMQDCNGVSNPSTTNDLQSVNTFNLNSQGELTCTVGTKPALALAAGIQSFRVLYGVDGNADRSVDRYLPASQMSADTWATVGSVQVLLTFTNPLDSTKPVVVTRTINLMNQS